MFNSLKVTNQLTPKSRHIIKRREEDEKNKTTAEAEGQSGNLAQSRGLQYVESIQNGKTPMYRPTVSNNLAYNHQIQTSKMSRGGMNRSVAMQGSIGGVKRPQQVSPQTSTQSATPAENSYLATHSPKINIAQVIGDFNNTALAIGTPEDTYGEVKTYLELVEKQTKKDGVNVKMIQSNLRNAALLLDQYISETLNKDSKVVENWIEAIFLQQVDYKYNEKDINEAFLVKMPEENKNKAQETTSVQPESVDSKEEIQSQKPKMDDELKELFLEAKNLTKNEDYKGAISAYARALNRALLVGDNSIKAKIIYEVGGVFDKQDDLPKALENYNRAIQETEDNNLKVKAHYSMAQIYDDVQQFKPAIEHYMAAISFAGETENFKAQTKSLTKIGNIYTDKYDKEAFNVYEDAKVVAEESKDDMVKGYVSSSIANAYNKFNKPTNALEYYSDAVKNYAKAGANEKVAINYKQAGELMQDYQKGEKGKTLIQKAILYAKKANNEKLVKELEKDLKAA